MNDKKSKTLHVRLTPEIKAILKKKAQEQGATMSSLASLLIIKGLESMNK